MPYTVKLANDELLTGQSWRQNNALFIDLPFTTGVVRVEENMGSALCRILALEKTADDLETYALTVCKNTSFFFV